MRLLLVPGTSPDRWARVWAQRLPDDPLDVVHADPAAAVDAVHAFLPDPRPKARHHKRRLVQPAHDALLRDRLRVGGTLHVATDWADYAAQMVDVLTGDPYLDGGVVERPAHRPVTRFEQRGLDLGHEVTDVVVRRVR